MLISLSGIDGVGKSTVARRVQAQLRDDGGVAARYVWCKFGDHPLSRYRLGRVLGKRQAAAGGRRGRSPPSAAYQLYGAALLGVHLVQIAFTVGGALRRGQWVICDRYIYDTMVDLCQELRYPLARAQRLMGARWIPRPGCRFWLDLAPEAAFARKGDSASVQYLHERRTLYAEIAGQHGLSVLDARLPVDAVVRQVMAQVTTYDRAWKGIRG
jgi:thymidylate kinase